MKYQIDVPAPEGGAANMTTYLRENERINRWHETYNAAAQGLFARGDLLNQVRRLAAEFADDTHGPL